MTALHSFNVKKRPKVDTLWAVFLFRQCIVSFPPKPKAMAANGMDHPHVAPAVAFGFRPSRGVVSAARPLRKVAAPREKTGQFTCNATGTQ